MGVPPCHSTSPRSGIDFLHGSSWVRLGLGGRRIPARQLSDSGSSGCRTPIRRAAPTAPGERRGFGEDRGENRIEGPAAALAQAAARTRNAADAGLRFIGTSSSFVGRSTTFGVRCTIEPPGSGWAEGGSSLVGMRAREARRNAGAALGEGSRACPLPASTTLRRRTVRSRAACRARARRTRVPTTRWSRTPPKASYPGWTAPRRRTRSVCWSPWTVRRVRRCSAPAPRRPPGRR